jgi:hypothetical protein
VLRGWPSDRLARLFKLERWNIGVVQRQPGDLSTLVQGGGLGHIEWQPRLSSRRYRADPFVWTADVGVRLIFEDYGSWIGRARICSVPLAAAEHGTTARLEISAATHLSYPFIVEVDGTCYCIPENAESGSVSIYGWKHAEHRWAQIARLIDEPVLDPTLYYHEDNWYLFGTLLNDGANSKLRIWHSRSLFGPWHRHQCNPVKTGGVGVRSAGPLFRDGDALFRPAQDATGGYGSAIIIHRIDLLTPDAYTETALSRLRPDPSGPYPNGLHTLTVTTHAIVIDGKKTELTWVAPFFKALWITTHCWRQWRTAHR